MKPTTMNQYIRKSRPLFVLAATIVTMTYLSVSTLSAQIISTAVDNTTSDVPTVFQTAVSTADSSDLILQGSSTLASKTIIQNDSLGGVAVLNDGTLGTSGATSSVAWQNFNVIYNLNTTTNTLGYNLSSIVAYTGWTDPSQSTNFSQQQLLVSYKLVGQSTFTTLGTYTATGVPSSTNKYAVQLTLTSSTSAPILSDVAALEFSDNRVGSQSVWREIQVTGVAAAAVPEPSQWSMILLGLAMCIGFQHMRKHRSRS